jgi:hypothetical protein
MKIFIFFAYVWGGLYTLSAFIFPILSKIHLRMSRSFEPILPSNIIEVFIIINAISLFVITKKHIGFGILMLLISDSLKFVFILAMGPERISFIFAFLYSYLDIMCLIIPLLMLKDHNNNDDCSSKK